MLLNIEIKARCDNLETIRKTLERHGARFVGIDRQIDTYFNVSSGRLKMREGQIENSLIHYRRADQAGPKRSDVLLYHVSNDSNLKDVLVNALGIWQIVDKTRQIFFIENVKFHLDEVVGLGTFVEIEAIDIDGTVGQTKLEEQCNFYLQLFKIKMEDLELGSYSNMLKTAKKLDIAD